MNNRTSAPTCETGWKPEHKGCPQCGPNGPCINIHYEALIQRNARRRSLVKRVLLFLLAFVIIGVASAIASEYLDPIRVARIDGFVACTVMFWLFPWCRPWGDQRDAALDK